MDIAVIGSGNVATQMSRAFRDAGHRIACVWSRNPQHAGRLAGELGAESVAELSRVPHADVYLVSVCDDAIGDVVDGLGSLPPEALLLHTAGSVPMDVLSGAGCSCGVLYPMQTLSAGRRIDFSSVPLFIEASGDAALQRLETLARSISGNVCRMDSQSRAHLHLAAVFACNFANHCFELARREMKRSGQDFSLLLPLIDETVSKVHSMRPDEAQTGPAVRKDTSVMQRHKALLDDPLTREIYGLMSRSIQNVADND